jgi:hypothetical protein
MARKMAICGFDSDRWLPLPNAALWRAMQRS